MIPCIVDYLGFNNHKEREREREREREIHALFAEDGVNKCISNYICIMYMLNNFYL